MADDGESKPHIIIDNGTGYCKAGLSGEEGPRAVFPACVGYPKYASGMVGGDKKEFFVGADAEAKRGVLKLNYPIEHGVNSTIQLNMVSLTTGTIWKRFGDMFSPMN